MTRDFSNAENGTNKPQLTTRVFRIEIPLILLQAMRPFSRILLILPLIFYNNQRRHGRNKAALACKQHERSLRASKKCRLATASGRGRRSWSEAPRVREEGARCCTFICLQPSSEARLFFPLGVQRRLRLLTYYLSCLSFIYSILCGGVSVR